MAGGHFTQQNKSRPGAYVNFATNELASTGLNTTGPVVIPLALNWGESEKFIKVTPNSKFRELFGKHVADIVPVREAFKATGQIIVYNLNGEGVKATATSDAFVATAVHGGTDGNKISVIVTVGLADTSTVKTYFDGEQVDSQTVAVVGDLVANPYVKFSGTLPTTDATLTLATGTTVPATNTSYSDLAAGLDTQDFKVLAVGTDDETIKSLLTLKVKEWREEAGKNVTLVTNDYVDADFDGVVSVVNGVTLEGNEVLEASEALYWFAAAYANAGTLSLTYSEYPGAIDCERSTHDEVVTALRAGHVIYTFNNGRVVVEQDINTFSSFTTEKNQDFRKNKLIRTMDIVSDGTQRVFSVYFIGKVTNNDDGRDLFKQELIKVVLGPLAQRGALEYISEEIAIRQGEEKDSVVVELGITFNDAMEKLYMTVNCK